MIDEKKLINYIKAQINPYGKPFEGTAYEFGLKVIDYIESSSEDDDWIPAEQPPEDERYVLLSFENFEVPLVGRCEGDKDSGCCYYVGDDEESCISVGLYVDAWMTLPKRYSESEEEKNE